MNLFLLKKPEITWALAACNLGLSLHAQDPQAIVWIVNPDAYLLKTSVDK